MLGQASPLNPHSKSRYCRSHELAAVSYAAAGTARRARRVRARITAAWREVLRWRAGGRARVVVIARTVSNASTRFGVSLQTTLRDLNRDLLAGIDQWEARRARVHESVAERIMRSK